MQRAGRQGRLVCRSDPSNQEGWRLSNFQLNLRLSIGLTNSWEHLNGRVSLVLSDDFPQRCPSKNPAVDVLILHPLHRP